MVAATLSGTRVVVVGGTSGIGKEVARQAVAAGAEVLVGSRSEQKLADTAKEIEGVRTGVVDVTDEESVRGFFGGLDALDHLVVCPGDMAVGSVYDVSLEAVRRSLDTKIIGPLLCVRHAGRKIAAGGSIVLLAGAAGYKAYPELAATAAANAGIGGLGRSLALELAPVRVNVVVAGLIDTPLWDGLPAEARAALFEQTAQATPLGRIGQPEDVARSVLHLLESAYTTGALSHVDGGATL
ncbi:NAD(P)-dependent dehydrogenase (short-subunit alcohol dehydrogenase family) [Kitasatospora sp. MAP12-15]|uniref:SDR family oxidoreductase n=1 Tax=unclassified Kitasatospora TaxID=2633591 RepID=UPI0024736EAB|nr:SDR family oxidoreductase [Kitasatospora sp. MAP12-44]MDH6112268.1 NAD(P)-dependent dehydrogenase (short-subunit alcohol dehydrogenase family) [Kitasatospora sp. MAP12-44]